jgi:hypothetical protein
MFMELAAYHYIEYLIKEFELYIYIYIYISYFEFRNIRANSSFLSDIYV